MSHNNQEVMYPNIKKVMSILLTTAQKESTPPFVLLKLTTGAQCQSL